MVDRAGRRTVVRGGSASANRPVRRVQRKRRLAFAAKRNAGTKLRDVCNDTGAVASDEEPYIAQVWASKGKPVELPPRLPLNDVSLPQFADPFGARKLPDLLA
jgi:hypothetical protein